MKKVFLYVFLTLFTFFFLSPVPSHAQCPLTNGQVDLRNCYFNSHTNAHTLGTSPGSLISSLLPNIIFLSGAVLLLIGVVSGFYLLQDAGQTLSAQEIAKRKAIFTSSMVGFLLVLSSYFILRIVSIVTGVNFLNPTLP